jgi:hypothetical protein
MTRIRSAIFVITLATALVAPGCTKHHTFPTTTVSFEVTFAAADGCGTEGTELCEHRASPMAFTASVRALKADGTLDTSFNGTVALSLVPSGLFSDEHPVLPDGRRVEMVNLVNGEAPDITLEFTRAFGEITLLVEDFGYTKAANVLDAACLDLFPAPGCFAVDDDDLDIGTGAAGVSEPIFFENPTIHDIQYTDIQNVLDFGGFPSPLFRFRVTVDAESRDDVPTLADCVDSQGQQRELMVVTALTVDGFYVTDVCNADGTAFAGVYMYNFHTPEDLIRGDCLIELTGTVEEFQGFTEMKNPFWVVDVDPDDPETPRCADLIPPPTELTSAMLVDDHVMEGLESGLVTIANATLAAEFRSCDLNGNGAIGNSNEWDCSSDCGDEIDCVVLESYQTYFQWSVNKDGQELKVATRGVIDFDPEENLGLQITRLTGTLRHLDFGRPQWTLEPRDDNDFEL